jgi:4-hydroxymandelate oxidase
MTHIPARHKVSPEIVNLADHQLQARQHLDDNAWA